MYGTEGTKAANETLVERMARWRREDPAWWATYDEDQRTRRHCPDPRLHASDLLCAGGPAHPHRFMHPSYPIRDTTEPGPED